MNSQLLPDKTYLLSAISSDANLFFSNDQDYLLFLKLYKEKLNSILSTLSFCLLPNELHLVIKINAEQDLFNFYKQNDFFPDENESLESIKKLNQSLAAQNFNVFDKHTQKLFTNFLNSFVAESKNQKQLAFNKITKSGLSKTELIKENDLVSAITTVHQLPVKNKVCKQIPDWKYSSYQAILSEKPSNINREFVLSLFESREKFISTVNNTNKIAEIEI
jgi:REP element-mobilizing transposase RayT